MVAARHWLTATHLGAGPGQTDIDPLSMPCLDFTPVVVRLSGITFLLVTVYLDCSIGLHGANLCKLAAIGAWLKCYKMPWICVGDWNCPPHILARHPWMTAVDGHIIVPRGT